MGFYFLENKKGQLNIEFIVAVILLALIVIASATAIVRMLPGFSNAADESNLRARATDFSRVLFDNPGVPQNWSSNPVIVGLAQLNNYSNETVKGAFDPLKVTFLNNSINYSQLKQNLSLEEDFNFAINISNQSYTFLDYYNNTPGRTDRTITIKK